MTPPAVLHAGDFAADIGATLATAREAADSLIDDLAKATSTAPGPGNGAPLDPAFMAAVATLAATIEAAEAAASSVRLAVRGR